MHKVGCAFDVSHAKAVCVSSAIQPHRRDRFVQKAIDTFRFLPKRRRQIGQVLLRPLRDQLDNVSFDFRPVDDGNLVEPEQLFRAIKHGLLFDD